MADKSNRIDKTFNLVSRVLDSFGLVEHDNNERRNHMATLFCTNHKTAFERSVDGDAWCPGCLAEEVDRKIQTENLALDKVNQLFRAMASAEQIAYERTQIEWHEQLDHDEEA